MRNSVHNIANGGFHCVLFANNVETQDANLHQLLEKREFSHQQSQNLDQRLYSYYTWGKGTQGLPLYVLCT